MKYLTVLCLLTLVRWSAGAALPIWEFLTYQEKMSEVIRVFMYTIGQYCDSSSIPDCEKMLALYGMSNLVNLDDTTLDFLDPSQNGAHELIWKRVMKGTFPLPEEGKHRSNKKIGQLNDEDYTSLNTVDYDFPDPLDSHPHAVRIMPPSGFQHKSPPAVRGSFGLGSFQGPPSLAPTQFSPFFDSEPQESQRRDVALPPSEVFSIIPFRKSSKPSIIPRSASPVSSINSPRVITPNSLPNNVKSKLPSRIRNSHSQTRKVISQRTRSNTSSKRTLLPVKRVLPLIKSSSSTPRSSPIPSHSLWILPSNPESVLPRSPGKPAGIQASADFEPLMMETHGSPFKMKEGRNGRRDQVAFRVLKR